MRRWILLCLVVLSYGASGEALRCISEVSAPYRFGFEVPDYQPERNLSARVVVPGLFGNVGRNTGKLELDFIARSRTGYLDFEGRISDFHRSYTATMWLNPERQDQMGRFRGLITIQMNYEIRINLLCRFKP